MLLVCRLTSLPRSLSHSHVWADCGLHGLARIILRGSGPSASRRLLHSDFMPSCNVEHAGLHFPVQGFLLLGSGKCVKTPVSLCPAWAHSLRTESRFLQTLHLPRGFPSRIGYFPGRGSARVNLLSLTDPSQGTPVPSWPYFIFCSTWIHGDRSCSFGCIGGDLLPFSRQCSVRTVPHADAFLACLWGEVSPTPSKSIILLISVSFEFFDMIIILIRKVIQNHLVDNYSHMSQRGFFSGKTRRIHYLNGNCKHTTEFSKLLLSISF